MPEVQAVVQRELPRVYLRSSPGQGLSEPLIASRCRPSLTQRFRFALKALRQFLVAVPRLSPSLLAAAFSAAWVRTMSGGSRAREIWPTGEGRATWPGRSQMEALPSVPPIRAPEKNSTAAANRRRPALDVCESRSLMFGASVIGQSCTRAARDNLGLRKVSLAPAAQAREVQMTALVLALSRY